MRKLIAVDAAALLAYALAANPAFTGIPVHEWLGLGAFVLIAVHFAMHAGWALETVRSRANRRGARLARLALDAMLVLAIATCAVSGFMVSGTALPALGLYATGYYFWDPLHSLSAKVLLALLIAHVALNWRVIVAGLKKKGVDHDG